MLKILQNHSLKQMHTFALNCKAKQVITVEDEADIDTLFTNAFFNDKYYIVGKGSNLLFASDFDGNIIHIATQGISVVKEDDTHIWLAVAAGEIFDDLVKYSVQNQWYGLENLAYIPGQVGSAAVQNIGAYGVEARDTIAEVHGRMIPTGEKRVLSVEECNYAYRDSIFKNQLSQQFLITSVVFKLSKTPVYHTEYKALQDYFSQHHLSHTIENVYNAVVTIRKSKLPEVEDFPSAGSYFKNPIISASHLYKLQQIFPKLVSYPYKEAQFKLAAGQLIELCGWKGYTNGKVGVYEKQALVLVNISDAVGSDIISLSNEIKSSVFEKFNVHLEEEVIVL